MKLIDSDFSIGANAEGLYVKTFQDIPQEFLDANAAKRYESTQSNANEYHEVASIPTVVVDKWLKEGFDVFKEPIKASVARLRAEGLDHFITTKKRL